MTHNATLTGSEVDFGMVSWFTEPSKAGFVYLFQAKGTNRYKIGRSKNFVTRLQTIQGQSPFELELVDYFYSLDCTFDESYIHKQKKQYRVFGEWFELSSKDSTLELNFMKSQFSENLAYSCLETFQYLQVDIDNFEFRCIFSGFTSETICRAKDIKGFQYFDTVVSNLPDLLNKTVRKRLNDEDYNHEAITNYAMEYIKFSVKTYTLLP